MFSNNRKEISYSTINKILCLSECQEAVELLKWLPDMVDGEMVEIRVTGEK